MKKLTEEQFDECSLTDEQLKAAKKVYKAIKEAHKLGVSFWDDYGTLSAFNNKKINLPLPILLELSTSEREDYYKLEDNKVHYWENLPRGAFFGGNADDGNLMVFTLKEEYDDANIS